MVSSSRSDRTQTRRRTGTGALAVNRRAFAAGALLLRVHRPRAARSGSRRGRDLPELRTEPPGDAFGDAAESVGAPRRRRRGRGQAARAASAQERHLVRQQAGLAEGMQTDAKFSSF